MGLQQCRYDRGHKLEDRILEAIHFKQQRENRMKGNRAQGNYGVIKYSDVCVISASEGQMIVRQKEYMKK